jgi:hypothetical protein
LIPFHRACQGRQVADPTGRIRRRRFVRRVNVVPHEPDDAGWSDGEQRLEDGSSSDQETLDTTSFRQDEQHAIHIAVPQLLAEAARQGLRIARTRFAFDAVTPASPRDQRVPAALIAEIRKGNL